MAVGGITGAKAPGPCTHPTVPLNFIFFHIYNVKGKPLSMSRLLLYGHEPPGPGPT